LRSWRLPEYVAIVGEPIDVGLARRIRDDFGITVRGLTFRAVIEHAHLDDNRRLRHEVAIVFDVDFDGSVAISAGSRQVSESDLLGLGVHPPSLSQCLTRPPGCFQQWTGWTGRLAADRVHFRQIAQEEVAHVDEIVEAPRDVIGPDTPTNWSLWKRTLV